jgi:hypothetical protein
MGKPSKIENSKEKTINIGLMCIDEPQSGLWPVLPGKNCR